MHKNKLLFLTLFFFSINYVLADENPGISIDNVWISEAPPTAPVLAAYAHIHNPTSKAQTLVSVSSPAFSKIELHLSKVVNGTSTMEKQTSLTIAANSNMELAPGAYHLMLFDPDKPYKSGEIVALNFIFSDGTFVSVTAKVKKRSNTTTNHDHDHEQHHDH